MTGGRLLALAGVFFGLVSIVGVVVVNTSCEGDFECGPAGAEAWVSMMVFGMLAVLFFLLAAVWWVVRRLS